MSLSQEIEAKINIVDLVSRYVPLKKAGMNYKALSPFVQEKTPSFVVSPAKNIAYCFSSHKWGGPIKFLMEIEKIEFREAVQILAKEAWIELKTSFAKERDQWEDIYALYKKTTEWYHKALYEEDGKKALSYLTDRGITQETIELFELGYSSNPRDLWYFLKDAGFSEKFVLESGIFLSPTKDKFFGRITFPIANHLGHIVGFTARVLDDGLPKYLNSPASKIFDKSSILYGLHIAKNEVTKSGNILIVEWQMDTISLHQAGVKIAVGISGTALTSEHIRLLKRFTKRIYLALDSDKAGVNATFSSIESIANEDIDLRIIQIPNGKDPDEYIKGGWKFDELFTSAIAPLTFFLREWSKKYDTTSVVGKRQLIDECLKFLTRVTSHSELDMYFREIGQFMGVSPDSLRIDFNRIKRTKPLEPKFQKKEAEVQDNRLEIHLPEKLAGYIAKFDFFDLFLKNFHYTVEELSWERDFVLLSKVVTRSPLDEDEWERLRLIEVIIEEETNTLSEALIAQTFHDMVRSLHKILFLKEKNQLLSSVSPDSGDYLRAYQTLTQRARELWLSQNVLKE